MKLFILAVFLSGVCYAAASDDKDVCYLLNGKVSDKPFPSLTQCYKNNQEACCVSAHDATIEGSYSGLLSTTCLREYQNLEHYFCLGCNPNMFKYIHWYNASPKCYDDSAAGTCEFLPFQCTEALCGVTGTHGWEKDQKMGMIKVCDDFLKQLLYKDSSCNIESTTCKIDKYDNCGLNLNLGSGDIGWYPSAFFVDAAGLQDPLKFLNTIRPPYFAEAEKFHISVNAYSAKNSAMVAKELGRVTNNACSCASIANCDCVPETGFPYFEAWTAPQNAPSGYLTDACFSAANSVHLSVLAVLAGLAALFAGEFM